MFRQKKIKGSIRLKYGLENQFTFSERVTVNLHSQQNEKKEKSGSCTHWEEKWEGRMV